METEENPRDYEGIGPRLNRILRACGITFDKAPSVMLTTMRNSRYVQVASDNGRTWEIDLILETASEI